MARNRVTCFSDGGATVVDPTPPLSGVLVRADGGSVANKLVSIEVDGVSVGTTTTDSVGAWSLSPTNPLSNATHTVVAKVVLPSSSRMSISVVATTPPVTLPTPTVPSPSILTTDPEGTVLGTITGLSAAATVGLFPSNGAFTLSGSGTSRTLLRGSQALSAGIVGVKVIQNLTGAANDGLETTINVTVSAPVTLPTSGSDAFAGAANSLLSARSGWTCATPSADIARISSSGSVGSVSGSTGAQLGIYLYEDFGYADHTQTMVMKSVARNSTQPQYGHILRYTDANNYIMVAWEPTGGLALYKRVAGAWTTSRVYPDPQADWILKAKVDINTATMEIGPVVAGVFTPNASYTRTMDVTNVPSSTRHGVWITGPSTASAFDDFTAAAIVHTPIVLPSYVGGAVQGMPYKYVFGPTGGTGGNVFSVTPGYSLPTGFSLSSSGVLTATSVSNTLLGYYPISIRVTDQTSQSIDSYMLLRVRAQVAATTGRVAQINSRIGAAAACVVPYTFATEQAAEHSDHTMHLHFDGLHTHISTKSGNWSDTTVWDTGTVPGAGAIVLVGLGHTVNYNLESSTALDVVHVRGHLTFDASMDTKMVVDTIYGECECEDAGDNATSITFGTQSVPILNSTTAGKARCEVVWKVGSTLPGATLRLGLVTHGMVRIYGQAKESILDFTANLAANATGGTVNGSLAGHRIGDKILIPSTDGSGASSSTDSTYDGPTSYYFEGISTPTNGFKKSRDEVVTIASLTNNGNGTWNITWSEPLLYAHTKRTFTLPRGQTITVAPCMGALQHSVRFRSYDPTVRQHRGHIMFMHSDNVRCYYAEAYNMARTDTDPTLWRPYTGIYTANPASGGTDLRDTINVRGRYAWHTHGGGPFLGCDRVIFFGLSAWADPSEDPIPGWAIVHHHSNALIENCVVFRVRGAALVSERGTEIGQWINNLLSHCIGDGFKEAFQTRTEYVENHNGHGGVGMECQARSVLMQRNRVTSAHNGAVFIQTNFGDNGARTPHHLSLRLVDPGLMNGNYHDTLEPNNRGTYGIEQNQIPDFFGNVFIDCDVGFMAAHRVQTWRYESTPMRAKDCVFIDCDAPIDIPAYTWMYSFHNCVAVRAGAHAGQVARIRDKTHGFNFGNWYVRGYINFWSIKGVNGRGKAVDIDHDCTATRVLDFDTLTMSSTNYNNPSTHPLGEIEGLWEKLANLQIKPRIASIISNPTVVSPTVTVVTSTSGYKATMDMTTDTEVSAIVLEFSLTDSLGAYNPNEWFWFDSISSDAHYTQYASQASAAEMLERNGYFFSGGKYWMPMFHRMVDRYSGADVTKRVDIEIQGVVASDLAAYPRWANDNAVAPDADLLPEALAA